MRRIQFCAFPQPVLNFHYFNRLFICVCINNMALKQRKIPASTLLITLLCAGAISVRKESDAKENSEIMSLKAMSRNISQAAFAEHKR